MISRKTCHINKKPTQGKRIWVNTLAIFACTSIFSVAHAACMGTAITSIPYTISNPGKYCLTSSLNTANSANAITIQTGNVVLDFDGHTITGPYQAGPSVSSAYAISFPLGGYYNNIIITNGTINGFWQGIAISGSNILVSKMRVLNTIHTGISISGENVTAIDNEIQLNPTNYNSTSSLGGTGLFLGGSYVDIKSNKISSIWRSDKYTYLTGISLSNGGSFINIENNIVSGESNFSPDKRIGTGIYLNRGEFTTVSNNIVNRWDKGIFWQYGAYQIYRNNITNGISFGKNYISDRTGITDGGGNI